MQEAACPAVASSPTDGSEDDEAPKKAKGRKPSGKRSRGSKRAAAAAEGSDAEDKQSGSAEEEDDSDREVSFSAINHVHCYAT